MAADVVVAPSQDLPAIRQSRIAALNQMTHPIIAVGLVGCVATLVVFSGIALMNGKLDSSNWGAIAAYLFGALSGALGVTAARAPQRVTDPTAGAATTTTASTTSNGGSTVSTTVTKP